MSAVLVTGATGFMGRVLVARLREEGRAVRVLERRPSDAFDGLEVERVTGDVTRADTLLAACADAETVFNLAGVLSYDAKDEARLQAVNVDGLANLLAAARQAGSGRVVHVSSVAAVGYTDDPARPQHEDSPFPEGAWNNRYSRSKRLGEEVVERAGAEGQDVVIACPGFLLGAGDVNRINTFVVEEYLRGRLRTTVAGGVSSVDVRDVADGLLAAERRGVSGRRYILTSEDGNLSHREFFALAGEVDGKRRRTVELPPALLVAGTRAGRALRLPMPLSPEEIEAACHYWYFTPARAMDELGFRPRPVRAAMEATVTYLRARGLKGRQKL
ncbi:MAG TPA: NAD-dependent epimerase/dehydratase family protein [Gaiellales bacterium]|jgi:dihydroflavonol-4-reductase|nr:NAD-dependent epimerase/dehydratase family protein [Gaiellales bacterium]